MGGGGSGGSGWGGGGGARVDVNEELKFLWKKKMGGRGVWSGGGGSGRGGVGLVGGQGGCKRRIEVFVKFQKKNFFFLGGGGSWGVRLGGGVRVDVNEELKFL